MSSLEHPLMYHGKGLKLSRVSTKGKKVFPFIIRVWLIFTFFVFLQSFVMPAGKIEEVEEGSNVYKIRTDFDDFTQYEIQNRSKDRIEAMFQFFDVENIRFELGPKGKLGVGGEHCFVVSVAPNETVVCVKLFTANDSDTWKFDYKLAFRKEEEPAWLDE